MGAKKRDHSIRKRGGPREEKASRVVRSCSRRNASPWRCVGLLRESLQSAVASDFLAGGTVTWKLFQWGTTGRNRR